MSFSRRTPPDLEPNELAQALEAKRAEGVEICDLTASNPTSVGLPYPFGDIAHALGRAGDAAYEPDPRGLASARRAVSAGYAERGLSVDEDSLLITASTSEAYAFLFKLLCDPGDEVLVPRPSYPLFDHLAALEGVDARSYRLRASRNWALDCMSVEAALGARARAVVLVSPNNPTGSVVGRRDLEDLSVLARDREIAMICDEVFADYLFPDFEGTVGSLLECPDVLGFTLGGLSKSAGMPHLKLGWIAVSGPEPLRSEALERLEMIADTYLSVSSPVQRALPRLLEIGRGIRESIAERVKANRILAARALEARGARMLPAAGGWYGIIPLAEGADEERISLQLLREDNVLVHPGYFFDMEGGHVVMSLLAEPEKIAEGLTCLSERPG